MSKERTAQQLKELHNEFLGPSQEENMAARVTGQALLSKDQVMYLAMTIGKVLLKSGAETSRVEDTMMRLCKMYGYYNINVFCTPTMIILGDDAINSDTLVFRVRWRFTDLGLIMYMNDFSYNIKKWNFTYEESMRWIEDKLALARPYGRYTLCLASALASACFSVLLGGNYHDFVAAFMTGFIALFILKQINSFRPSAFWENFIGGFLIGIIALIFCRFDKFCTMERIVVGALMPFLPGGAFTNGLRDYMAGDLLSGNSRIGEAVLFAVSVAVGIAFALRIWVWMGWPV